MRLKITQIGTEYPVAKYLVQDMDTPRYKWLGLWMPPVKRCAASEDEVNSYLSYKALATGRILNFEAWIADWRNDSDHGQKR